PTSTTASATYWTTPRRSGEVGTRFGKVKFSRAIGRRLGGRGRADLPVDRELAERRLQPRDRGGYRAALRNAGLRQRPAALRRVPRVGAEPARNAAHGRRSRR